MISVRRDDLTRIIANDEGQITWIDLSVGPRQGNRGERVLSIVKRLKRVIGDQRRNFVLDYWSFSKLPGYFIVLACPDADRVGSGWL